MSSPFAFRMRYKILRLQPRFASVHSMLELVVPHVHLLFLLNYCHSCRQTQFPRSTVHNFAQALFLITVLWNVSVPCVQHPQELLKIFEFDERLLQTVLHGPVQTRILTSAPC